MTDLHALALSRTLTSSPTASSTEMLARQVLERLDAELSKTVERGRMTTHDKVALSAEDLATSRPSLTASIASSGAGGRVKGAVGGARKALGGGDDEDEGGSRRPAKKSSTRRRSSA